MQTRAVSITVACRQAPARSTSDHICFSSALRLGSVDPEKVPVCCCWMWDFDQSALNLYTCVCVCAQHSPLHKKHKMFSSPANLLQIDLISPLLKEGEGKHNIWIWAFSQHGMKGELPLALKRAEPWTWFPDVQYEKWRSTEMKDTVGNRGRNPTCGVAVFTYSLPAVTGTKLIYCCIISSVSGGFSFFGFYFDWVSVSALLLF